ncbi:PLASMODESMATA CALLOSE-BINDING PROTEIN 3-like protein [Carex littledalei]|uniref:PLASMODESMATA CALLOSE-BINDING PROTEIN 3-like protein n=1 Tax=Carex littledalei TaxID=544730 RepID=A0A833QKC4_9POAL|nr:PLASMODESMATA CALLOSE-BINDING PROTEIN 3-like protein [Carex littledalei]
MLLVTLLLLTVLLREDLAQGATWCICKSGTNQTALQLALDYACGPGVADCAPIQSSGLCYLPNTLQAHASYAFNSYYQRSNAAPGACDFGGAAIVTVTDPSTFTLSLSLNFFPAFGVYYGRAPS